MERHGAKDIEQLARSDARRKEDHSRIIKLQKQLLDKNEFPYTWLSHFILTAVCFVLIVVILVIIVLRLKKVP